MNNLTIQTPHIFLKDLLHTLSHASQGDAIWLQSMLFEPGEYIEAIVDTVCNAKSRGVMVYVLIDSFGILTTNEIPTKSFLTAFQVNSKIRRMEQEKQILIEKLKKAGIEFRIGGSMGAFKQLWPLPFCNHRKSYGLMNKKKNKYIAWITGINLANVSFSQYDIAVKTQNEELVEQIYQEFLIDYSQKNQWKNKEYVVNSDTMYLIENNGYSSNIRKQAYELVNHAEKFIRFITQYPVDPILLQRFIKKAKQGVKVEVLTSHNEDEFNFREPFGFFNRNFNKAIVQNPNIIRRYFPGKVHAKLLYSEQEALIGSDNLSIVLKLLQTKEDMLYVRSNKDFTLQLNNFFENK